MTADPTCHDFDCLYCLKLYAIAIPTTEGRVNWSVFFQEWARALLRYPAQIMRSYTPRECPICGFTGRFVDVGPRRTEARCPNCSSKERDRLIGLYLERADLRVDGKKVLHFSPERPFFRKWKYYPNYVAGDIKQSRKMNTYVDITDIPFHENTFDLILCNHILEHVPNHRQGIQECYRVLAPRGAAFFSVPIYENQQNTFELEPGTPLEEVERLCGGYDHKRRYGQDFPELLRKVGFHVIEIRHDPDEVNRFRMGEDRPPAVSQNRVFIATKPTTPSSAIRPQRCAASGDPFIDDFPAR